MSKAKKVEVVVIITCVLAGAALVKLLLDARADRLMNRQVERFREQGVL